VRKNGQARREGLFDIGPASHGDDVDPIAKALWHIESRPAEDLSLEAIAATAGVSRFYLSRAFTEVIGRPVVAYARARRLSLAALALADDAKDILSLALEAGYGSHEAFTRAFRNQFGVTPEQVRGARDVSNLDLVEPFRMGPSNTSPLAPPRFADRDLLLLVGYAQRHACADKSGISGQWMRFAPHIGAVKNQKGADAYGAVTNHDDAGNFDYFAAVEVTDFEDLPAEYARLRVPAQRYAVFNFNDHISAISAAFSWIWGTWLPGSGHTPSDAPVLERYTPAFDPSTGMGGVELWIPIKG
jgi:AraC family transcriptional regulator